MKNEHRRGRTGDRVLWGALAFAASAGVALAQSYQFTTCGATGRSGPSQGACDSAYAATNLAGNVAVTDGIQAWTVPQTGRYKIEAFGAQGGTQVFSPGFPGGRGAYISGDFDLVAGQTVYVLVGQRGGDTREDEGSEGDIDNAAPGGGGGSFVYLNVNAAFPLVAAGGGAGGSRCSSVDGSLRNGNAGTSGNRSGSLANGGSNGNGGLSNFDGSSYWAGGGSGWLTDGTGDNNPTNYDYTPGEGGAEGGRAPRNGGIGGLRWNDDLDEGGDGGFGGGGGGGSDNMGTGGGGGYSGGGGARSGDEEGCENEPGGGGGSYNGGTNQSNIGGENSGHGAVRITPAESVATAVPTASTWTLLLMALALAVTGFVAVRRT